MKALGWLDSQHTYRDNCSRTKESRSENPSLRQLGSYCFAVLCVFLVTSYRCDGYFSVIRGEPMAVPEGDSDILRCTDGPQTSQERGESQVALDIIPTLVWRANSEGAVQFCNQRWLEYTGLAFEDARDWGWGAAIHPDDFPRLMAEWRSLLAAGKHGEFEGRLRRFDGEYRWFLFRTEPLRNRSGEVISWYGVNIDIQKFKHVEDALRRSEAYSAEAQRLSLTGSFGRKRGANEILFWSEEMYRIFGFEPGTKVTIELAIQRVHPDDVAHYQHMIERMACGDPDISTQYRLLMPDGTVKHVRVLAHATLDETGQPEYVGAVMDISAAIRAQEAFKEAHAALAHVTRIATLGELMASIAHEVNQPLAAIVTNGEASLRWLGRAKPELGEARSAVEEMISDAIRASEVLRRLRALSRKEAPQNEPVNLTISLRNPSRSFSGNCRCTVYLRSCCWLHNCLWSSAIEFNCNKC